MDLKGNQFYSVTPKAKGEKEKMQVVLEIDSPTDTYHMEFLINAEDLQLFLFEYALFKQEMVCHDVDFGYFIQDGQDENVPEETAAFSWLKNYPLTSSWFHSCTIDPIVGIEITYIDSQNNSFKIDVNEKELMSYVNSHLGEKLMWRDLMKGPQILLDKSNLEQTIHHNLSSNLEEKTKRKI